MQRIQILLRDLLQQAGSTEAVSYSPGLFPVPRVTLSVRACVFSSQDACEEASHDPGATPEEVQVHGAAASLHKALLPRGFPAGAAAVQHLWRRR